MREIKSYESSCIEKDPYVAMRTLEYRISAFRYLSGNVAGSTFDNVINEAFYEYKRNMTSLIYEAAKDFVAAYEAAKAKQVTPKETNDD